MTMRTPGTGAEPPRVRIPDDRDDAGGERERLADGRLRGDAAPVVGDEHAPRPSRSPRAAVALSGPTHDVRAAAVEPQQRTARRS